MSNEPWNFKKLDYSAFTKNDLVNIILQRSDVLSRAGYNQKSIRNWMNGDEKLIHDVVEKLGTIIAVSALEIIYEEYCALKDLLTEIQPKHIADIGCGYAFFDFFAAHDFDAKLLLIDIEENKLRHFGFNDSGAAYANLETTTSFLTANGVAKSRIKTINPTHQKISKRTKVDLIVSLISCGFHYPTDLYHEFFEENLTSGGRIILDIRAAQLTEEMKKLQHIGPYEVISEAQKIARVMITKK